MSMQVMVVDDDAAVCWALDSVLTRAGYRVVVCGTTSDALRRIAQHTPGVVLTDQRMPGGSGLDLLTTLRQEHPRLPVIVMTAYGSIETASKVVTAGAYDYLPKPLDLQRTLTVIERALGKRELAIEVAPGRPDALVLVGVSPVMQEVMRRLALAAGCELPVMITGPTGSGKELAARLVHQHSRRAACPLIPVTGGLLATSDPLAALVGTDGDGGLLAAATGGTLLFDEIGDLPPELQVAVLGLIDHGGPRHDVRIIAISNRDLTQTPGFRSDLVHRLAVMTLPMPGLAERPEDLPLLIGHLLTRISTYLGRPLAMTDAALATLHERAWPGNVREVRHVLEEAAVLAPGGTIDVEHVRPSGAPAALQSIFQEQATGSVRSKRFSMPIPGRHMPAGLIESNVLCWKRRSHGLGAISCVRLNCWACTGRPCANVLTNSGWDKRESEQAAATSASFWPAPRQPAALLSGPRLDTAGMRWTRTAILAAVAVSATLGIVFSACGRPDPTTPAVPAAATGAETMIGFEDMPIGQPPVGFRCAWPGPPEAKPARWEIVADDAGRVLQQSDGDETNNRFPVALWPELRLADVRASVKARAISGGRDRSFGVVVRAMDERNYYVARANTSGWGENVRLYKFVDGKRTQLAEWEGPVARDAWHDLALEAVGGQLTVMLDGRTVIRQADSTFAGPGMAGVWTKAEAVSRFDDLRIAPLGAGK